MRWPQISYRVFKGYPQCNFGRKKLCRPKAFQLCSWFNINSLFVLSLFLLDLANSFKGQIQFIFISIRKQSFSPIILSNSLFCTKRHVYHFLIPFNKCPWLTRVQGRLWMIHHHLTNRKDPRQLQCEMAKDWVLVSVARTLWVKGL